MRPFLFIFFSFSLASSALLLSPPPVSRRFPSIITQIAQQMAPKKLIKKTNSRFVIKESEKREGSDDDMDEVSGEEDLDEYDTQDGFCVADDYSSDSSASSSGSVASSAGVGSLLTLTAAASLIAKDTQDDLNTSPASSGDEMDEDDEVEILTQETPDPTDDIVHTQQEIIVKPPTPIAPPAKKRSKTTTASPASGKKRALVYDSDAEEGEEVVMVMPTKPILALDTESDRQRATNYFCFCPSKKIGRFRAMVFNVVKKEGTNYGREFLCCPAAKGEGCGRFLFLDQPQRQATLAAKLKVVESLFKTDFKATQRNPELQKSYHQRFLNQATEALKVLSKK